MCLQHLVGRGRDAAEHPAVYGIGSTAKNYPAQDVRYVEVEKPQSSLFLETGA